MRVPTSTEQIRVESGERGLRVERGTEGKLEGRGMLGMVTGLVCLRYEHTDVPCWARYEMEEDDAESGRSTMSIGDVLKGSQNRCGENCGEGGVCLHIRDIASAGISTGPAWRVDIW